MTSQRTLLTRLIATLAILAMFATGCGSSSDDAAEVVDEVSEPVAGSEKDSDDSTDSDDSADMPDAPTEAPEEAMLDDSSGAVESFSEESEPEAGAVAEDRIAAGDEATDEYIEPGEPGAPLPSPEPEPRPQAGLLTAAEVNDNLNYDFFLGYLDRTATNFGQLLPYPDLTQRISLEVVDSNGVGIANTPVRVSTDGGPEFIVHTNSAGTARFFPNYSATGWTTFDVEVAGTTTTVSTEDANQGAVTITAEDGTLGGAPQALDIAFVLDVTGSMSDELNYLTVEFESIIERLRQTYPDADLRFGMVSYRDIGDDFVTQVYDFTNSVSEMRTNLADQRAEGGGDYPEAMDAALLDANDLSWRDGDVARVMILNADAPPHDDDLQATLDAADTAASKGIRIYPLAASGVADTAEYMMRVMALTTGGSHLFLTADSGIGGEKQEPKTQCYQVTNLDSLLLRVLESELAGEKIEPNESEIIRQVGNYDRGVCSEQ